MLTAAEVVAETHGTGLAQVKDGEIDGQAGTALREFSDPGHIFFIALSLYEAESPDSAAINYPRLRDSRKAEFGTINETLAPTIGSAARADEWIGTLSGRPGIAVTFQQGPFLCAEFAESNAGFVTDTIGPGVASAESQKIHDLTGE